MHGLAVSCLPATGVPDCRQGQACTRPAACRRMCMLLPVTQDRSCLDSRIHPGSHSRQEAQTLVLLLQAGQGYRSCIGIRLSFSGTAMPFARASQSTPTPGALLSGPRPCALTST